MDHKMLILMRGPPGSGKSQIANTIRNNFTSSVIHSADDFFLSGSEYKFDGNKLWMAHRFAQTQASASMIEETEVVIIDNTNIKREHYKPYLDMAKKYGYDVYQVVCSGSFDNVHGVPEHVVSRMRNEFEQDNDLPTLEM